MYTLKIKWEQSIFALLSGFFFLFFFSSSVLASPEELAAVKQQIRNNGARWQAAETSISKLPAEQRSMRLGFHKESFSVPQGTPVISSTPAKGGPASTSPPATLNYNLDSYVTPIRDQGNCGSCWAFSTTAALESQYLMSTKGVGWSSFALAPQILLSCSNAGNCSAGGYIDLASEFIQSTGLPVASLDPYTEANWTSGPDSPCSNAATYWYSDTYSTKGWEWVATTSPTAAALESALNTYGPLVTTMNVYTDFYYYSGGVYSYTYGTYEGGHAIEIIGYNHADQYFIVKNSWGNNWGTSVPGSVTGPGFFLIAYDQIPQMTKVKDGGPEFGWYTIAYEGYKPLQNTCTYTISPKSVTLAYSAGSATVSVTSPSECSWTAASNASWISVVSGAKGTADGTVKYSVTANTSTTQSRTGTLTIAGQTFTVTQQAK